MEKGRIIGLSGGLYKVLMEDNRIIEVKARGKLRNEKRYQVNPKSESKKEVLVTFKNSPKVGDIAYIGLDELTSIEGFDADLATELQNRAKAYLVAKEAEVSQKLKELKLAEDLTKFEGLSSEMLVKLGEAGVKTLDDLADLAGDELREIVGDELSEENANALIMKAREHWFSEEEQSQK